MMSESVNPYFTRLFRGLTFLSGGVKNTILKENAVAKGVVKRIQELRIFTNWRSVKSIIVPKKLLDFGIWGYKDFLVQEVIFSWSISVH